MKQKNISGTKTIQNV